MTLYTASASPGLHPSSAVKQALGSVRASGLAVPRVPGLPDTRAYYQQHGRLRRAEVLA